MLKTETNTPEMESRILNAFNEWRPGGCHPVASADFEHGQWWVTCGECGAQFSVVDADGGAAVDGFDFEQVTEGVGGYICADEEESNG
jgi:hypothetical protein